MTGVRLNRPWLEFELGDPMQVLSWAINRPGFVTARRIVWREVRNADLPPDMDVQGWFDSELAAHDLTDAVAFLTSRDVSFHHQHTSRAGDITAQCVATVGLSNAERVGQRVDRSGMDWGTINVAVRLSCGLSQAALIEALSIAAQARTAAVMDVGLELPGGGIATGTGTDCIAVAAPNGPSAYAGLHTETGEAIGAAVYRATLAGAQEWMADVRPVLQGVGSDGGVVAGA